MKKVFERVIIVSLSAYLACVYVVAGVLALALALVISWPLLLMKGGPKL